MQIERLEERQLLAGAKLIGIQPNDGDLLQTGAIRHVAPSDLTFRFDQLQQIDPASLGSSTVPGGIQITRSNLDGVFAPATVSSDFGTGINGVSIEFSAVRLGQDQNGITLSITKSDFGGPGLPGISVIGRTINISLNINQNNQTTAQNLVEALQNSIEASNLIAARIARGSGSVKIAATAPANSSLVLAGANDVVVQPGYIGVSAEPARNEVVFRFAGQPPDDVYRIDVFGTGATPLKNVNGERYLDGKNSTLVFELDLAPQIVAVVPQPVVRLANGSLVQERNKIAVYFNNDDLHQASAQNRDFYKLIYTNDTLENKDDLVFQPIDVEYSADKDMALLTFASDLAMLVDPQGAASTFRLRIGTNESLPLAPVTVTPETRGTGTYLGVPMEMLGLTESWGKAVQIDVYQLADAMFEREHGAGNSPSVSVLENVITVDLKHPTTAQQLADAINQHFNAGKLVQASVAPADAGTLITTPITDETSPPVKYSTVTLTGLGSSYDTATDLGTLEVSAIQQDLRDLIVRGRIEPQVYNLVLPGGNDEPGHRDIDLVQHVPDEGSDRDSGITRLEYNFRQDIGFLIDARGNRQTAFNVITETQKRRAREVFQILSDLIGVEFVETERDGLIIASGDSLAFNPDQPLLRPLDVNLNDRFNGSWFRTALLQITSYLGLSEEDYIQQTPEDASTIAAGWAVAPELPGRAIGDIPGSPLRASDADLDFDNTIEPTIMSDQDLVHLRYLYFPESKDIDMFRFELPVNPSKPEALGHLAIETMAERRLQSSLLDTAVTLWRENADGTRELLARNDNYFGRDSYLELDLAPGTYYVGVSASGNDEYDPAIEDSGFGGTTQGEYELRLTYRPDVQEAIADIDNPNDPSGPTFLDGDGDGVPGGVYNFWFKTAPALLTGTPTSAAETIFVDKSYTPAAGSGTLSAPYNNLATALSKAGPGDIVRIVGNAGSDANWATLADNKAYQIGFNSLGAPLPDGSTLEVPRGVTVMVDAGAIFQMRRARINVGSSAAGIDRSGGALQVLGTPILLTDSNANGGLDLGDAVVPSGSGAKAAGSVYFTSYNDQDVGLDTNPYITSPAAGDWGGIEFRNDVDRSQGAFLYEEEGIFLNYVNHADVRYGGGTVLINSVPRTINPIHLTDARPTLTYNRIYRSADAAVSASPDSFEETNFHAPRHQRIPFTSDYQRIGPEIHHNNLVDNSVNGLFVRIGTQAGSTAQKLTVSGRWDDVDIVHIMSENLAIASQPGGAMERVTAPAVALVVMTPTTGGSLNPGLTPVEYSYRLVYVDRFGYESPASVNMAVTLTGTGRAVQFTQLPPAPSGYVARRLYRSENQGPYALVAELNRLDATYKDMGKTRGQFLDLPPVTGVVLSSNPSGSLLPGTYRYRITYVDSLGQDSRASDATATITITGNPTEFGTPGDGIVTLDNLPLAAPAQGFVGRRIYRSVDLGDGNGYSEYQLIAELDDTLSTGGYLPLTQFDDDGSYGPADDPRYREIPQNAVLDNVVLHGRPDARLMIDPSVVVKLDGARFELEMGAQLIAEGSDGREIIFTSISDDRYGAGGNFDTGNDGAIITGTSNDPAAGNWGGIYGGHLSNLSIDHAVFAYGGGVTRVEGTFTGFNVVEVHDHAEARIANSIFEFNGPGQGGQGELDRFGRGFNEPGVVFVRQAQPVIYNNIFRNNPDADRTNTPTNPNVAVPAISINVNALNYVLKRDTGRTTGAIDRVGGYRDNQGPLILANRLDNNEINGMVVRGQTLTTQSVWDDADIVHVLLDTVYVPDFHTFGGLVLASNATESLVVKMLDNNQNDTKQIGFVATGIPHEIDDRIGGIIQILGQPGSPVVLTSLRDDRHSAGVRLDGSPQNDTNADGDFLDPAKYPNAQAPQPGDWNSVLLDRFSHDRNVESFYEYEARDVNSPGPNGSPDDAELLGILAPSEYAADENRRLGFTVKGFLADQRDLDVYSVKAIPGTEVWIDIDRTTQALDAVIELLDSDGKVLARSTSSPSELANPNNFLEPQDRTSQNVNLTERELADPSLLSGAARLMLKTPQIPGQDLYTTNPRDPGLRVVLPGVPNAEDPERPLTYHIRVLSNGPTFLSDEDAELTFHDNGAQPDTITVTNGDFRDAGFARGQGLVISGTLHNDGVYTITGLAADQTLTLAATDRLQPETAAAGARLTAPLTAGAYQLQVRLREVDEIGGSTVRYATIAYATNGLEVRGQPSHSPLSGESGESASANDSTATAQGVGNLLNSDRGTISVAGSLDVTGADVDFYEFNINYLDPDAVGLFDTIFDVDYANGLGDRPDVSIHVYDGEGRLILTARDGNIAEDRPATPGSADIDDLSRGTVGATDPFLGVISLPTGTYQVAISSDRRMPSDLDQFVEAIATNPYVRLEPIETIRRIAEDHIEVGNTSTADPPQVSLLFDDQADVAYHLGDVTLYLYRAPNPLVTDLSELVTIDPFTGALETNVGSLGGAVTVETGDLAMPPTGGRYS